MGVPSLFRIVISKYPKTHYPAKGNEKIDFFFMDFNCLIYHCLGSRMVVENEKYSKGLISDEKFEELLIAEVIKYTHYIVTKVCKPEKLLYIAIDGPPPRAKMVQQRMRRFKGQKEGKMKQTIYDKYDVKSEKRWDKSALTPGTPFMLKLGEALKKTAEAGDFGMCGDGKEHLRVIISDSSVPGEGEHKIIPYMRKIKAGKDDVFSIYGLDADLIILAMDTYQKKIVLLREPQKSYHEIKLYSGVEFLYLDIEKFRESFVEELDLGAFELDKVVNDFTFLTFLGGNDFVTALPYLEVKSGGLDMLLSVYKNLLPEMDGHLVIDEGKGGKGGKKLNSKFFKAILEKLGMMEGKMLRLLQIRRDRFKHNDSKDPDDAMERELEIFEHEPYYSEVHPQYEEYQERMTSIDYKKSRNEWRQAYYKEFFMLDMEGNEKEFLTMRTEICHHYMESLLWTLKYYLDGIPSWTWYYKFRAAPFITDLQSVLHKVSDVNVLGKFDLGQPYRPLEQLMFVMPPGCGGLLPKELSKLMTDIESPVIEYYPVDFELDIMNGLKHIYSEPVLPLIDDSHLLGVIRPIISKLEKKGKEGEGNKVVYEPSYYWFPEKMRTGNGKAKVKTKVGAKAKAKVGAKEKAKTKVDTKVETKAKKKFIKITPKKA